MTKTGIAVGIVVLLAVGGTAAARLLDDGGSAGPPDREPRAVQVLVDPSLRAGRQFQVRYAMKDGGDPGQLRPSVSLTLWDEGKAINTLVSGGKPQPAEAASIPAVELRGPGPFKFTLPDLRSGDYALCGYVNVEGLDDDGRFCRTVEVRGS